MITEKQKIARASTMMALSNLGHLGLNVTAEDLLARPESWNEQVWADTCQSAGHLMESDEHERYFCEEAEWWEKAIVKVGLPAFAAQYSHNPWLLDIVNA